MNEINYQLNMWKTDFGDAYVDRVPVTQDAVAQKAFAFSEIFRHIEGQHPSSILEVGANVGINLHALKKVTDAELYALEPNDRARRILEDSGVLPKENVFAGKGDELPFGPNSFDMVFTSTVLIHVPDETLSGTYENIYRVASRYILAIEYFAQKTEVIHYRGFDDLLFKRDFGALWLDGYPKLRPVANGFFWKRTTGLDDLTWWLFEK